MLVCKGCGHLCQQSAVNGQKTSLLCFSLKKPPTTHKTKNAKIRHLVCHAYPVVSRTVCAL